MNILRFFGRSVFAILGIVIFLIKALWQLAVVLIPILSLIIVLLDVFTDSVSNTTFVILAFVVIDVLLDIKNRIGQPSTIEPYHIHLHVPPQAMKTKSRSGSSGKGNIKSKRGKAPERSK